MTGVRRCLRQHLGLMKAPKAYCFSITTRHGRRINNNPWHPTHTEDTLLCQRQQCQHLIGDPVTHQALACATLPQVMAPHPIPSKS